MKIGYKIITVLLITCFNVTLLLKPISAFGNSGSWIPGYAPMVFDVGSRTLRLTWECKPAAYNRDEIYNTVYIRKSYEQTADSYRIYNKGNNIFEVTMIGLTPNTNYVMSIMAEGGAPNLYRVEFRTKQDGAEYSHQNLMLSRLLDLYYGESITADKERILNLYNQLQNFDISCFDKVVLLNDSKGAFGYGHNAILLVNQKGESLFFSYHPSVLNVSTLSKGVDGELRFSSLTKEQTKTLNQSGNIYSAITKDGKLENEQYNNFVCRSISNQQGIAMLEKASEIFISPGIYDPLSRQCDNVAKEIMSSGDIGYGIYESPNLTYYYVTQMYQFWNVWKIN